MGIYFGYNGKHINGAWPSADEFVTILHDLDVSFNPNDLINIDADEYQASEISETLKTALEENKIGLKYTNQDSLGRVHNTPFVIVSVNGNLPLDEPASRWIQSYIDLYSNTHGD